MANVNNTGISAGAVCITISQRAEQLGDDRPIPDNSNRLASGMKIISLSEGYQPLYKPTDLFGLCRCGLYAFLFQDGSRHISQHRSTMTGIST
jgi:hypothetical protein